MAFFKTLDVEMRGAGSRRDAKLRMWEGGRAFSSLALHASPSRCTTYRLAAQSAIWRRSPAPRDTLSPGGSAAAQSVM